MALARRCRWIRSRLFGRFKLKNSILPTSPGPTSRCRAHERSRGGTEPGLLLADDQLRWDGGSRVGFEIKTPWRDGTTHPEMTPVDVLERLAALVARPRLHLVRVHGILAPNAKLRSVVVPRAPATARPVATTAPTATLSLPAPGRARRKPHPHPGRSCAGPTCSARSTTSIGAAARIAAWEASSPSQRCSTPTRSASTPARRHSRPVAAPSPARIPNAERDDGDARSEHDFTPRASRKPARQGDKAASRGKAIA